MITYEFAFILGGFSLLIFWIIGLIRKMRKEKNNNGMYFYCVPYPCCLYNSISNSIRRKGRVLGRYNVV